MVVKKESRYIFLSVFLGGVLLCLLLLGKMYYMSMTEFDMGIKLERQREYYKAIVHYDRALRCFSPYNPYIRRSLKRLLSIGEQFEKNGKNKDALVLYENIHGTLLSTQSLLVKNSKKLTACSIKINKLLHYQEKKSKLAPANIFLSFLQGITLLGWIFLAVIFIHKNNNKTVLVCLASFFVVWFLSISFL